MIVDITGLNDKQIFALEVEYFKNNPNKVDYNRAVRAAEASPYEMAKQLYDNGSWISSSSLDKVRQKGREMIDKTYKKLDNYMGYGGVAQIFFQQAAAQPVEELRQSMEKKPLDTWNSLKQNGIVKESWVDFLKSGKATEGSSLDNPLTNMADNLVDVETKAVKTAKDIGETAAKVVNVAASNIEYLPYIAVAGGLIFIYITIKR